jgi:GAF domain-containing protein
MRDEFAAEAAAQGDDDRIRAILEKVCSITDMGFAAVARVTEDRWIACQVLDKIEFGMEPGSELDIKTTICSDIRKSGKQVIIDQIAADENWRTHPIPILYGFKSYASLPITLTDGSFFGTLCAIDPEPRAVSAPETVAMLESFAREVAGLLSPTSV